MIYDMGVLAALRWLFRERDGALIGLSLLDM